MAENYRGPVAFSFDPPDAFWTDKNSFEKFVISCFKNIDTGTSEDSDYSIYSGKGFNLADHRDTAGAYRKADSVEDFVKDNLDLSTCQDTIILDAYVNVDKAHLIIKVLSSDTDIAEIKHWELTPYETMSLERIEALDEDDTYKLVYKIDGLNRTYSELYDENKIELFKSILKECSNKRNTLKESARACLSAELRQFVARFVRDMSTVSEGIKDYDEMMDAYAELAIREANWVGLPVEVLRNLNFILSDDCLNCDMWDLVNSIIKLTNKKDN